MSEAQENPDSTRIRIRLTNVDPAIQGSVGHQTIVQMLEVFEDVLNIVAQKEVSYGGAWREQGWMGNLSRILSKSSRLKNMLWTPFQQISSSEPPEETVADLIALCVFFLLNRRRMNGWGHDGI